MKTYFAVKVLSITACNGVCNDLDSAVNTEIWPYNDIFI